MKKIEVKRNVSLLLVLALCILVTFSFAFSQLFSYAAEDELSDVPESGVTYTLKYPDGTEVTINEVGEPLTYQDVEEAMKEENWLLLASDLKSDEDGHVNLPVDWDINGTIRIVETKVPDGYTEGDVTEQTLPLEEGSATFVNPKDPDPEVPEPVDPEPAPVKPEPDPVKPEPDPVKPEPAPVKPEPDPVKPEPKEKYTITYKLNGGEFNGSTEDIKETYEEDLTIKIHDAPTRDGYRFDYWEGSKYQPGDEYKVTEDHTFTAQWKKNDTPINPSNSSTPSKTIAAKTGDASGVATSLFTFMIAALALLMVLGRQTEKVASSHGQENSPSYKGSKTFGGRKPIELALFIGLILIIVFASICFANTVFADDGFVINKIDDNDDPVEGAIFDIYGKPEVTWEELPPETTSVTVSKVWDDADNQDGIRPASVTVSLKANDEQAEDVNGTAIGDITLDETNEWKATIDNLPKYDSGTEITYTVTEEVVPEGYNASVSGTTVTNKHTPATTKVSGSKTWNDADDQDGKRPESITVNLLADGEKVDSKTVSSGDGWKYSFTDLPKYKNGTEIVYTVSEEAVEDYTTTINGFNITNAHTPETTIISGTKTWPDDETVKMGWTMPGSIEVTLKKDEGNGPSDVETKMVTKDAGTGEWTYDFGQQPRYSNGTEIEYYVVEKPVAGYKASGGTTAENYDLNNEYDERTITLTKTWADDSTAPSGTRPTSFMFPLYLQLYKNDELWAVDAPMPEVVDNGNDTYTVTYTVPRADENGNEYEYKIEETNVPDYMEGEVTGNMEDGFAVTNTYDKRTITLTKTWAADDRYTGKRPTTEGFKQYVELLQDGAVMSGVTPTVEQGTASYRYVLTYTVPRFKVDGTEYTYTIREKAIPYYKNGYVTGNMNDGFAVTNELDTVHFTVNKIWVDEGNGDKRNPAGIDWQQALAEMFMLSDGETETLGSSEHYSISGATHEGYDPEIHNEITITFNDLPKYKDGPLGEPELINWTIRETPPEGYTETHTTVTQNSNGDYEVTYTNTYGATSDGFNISVSMNYENGPWADLWGPDIGWGGIVRGSQTVTITNTDTGDVNTLTFTPAKGGGMSAAQTVQLAEGTYTVSQTAYALGDLDASADGDGYFIELYLMRTIDQTITIDSSGKCTLSTSGKQPGDSFYAQYYFWTEEFNPETGDHDIPVFEPSSDFNETGFASGYDGSCVVSDDSITLKSIILHSDPELDEN